MVKWMGVLLAWILISCGDKKSSLSGDAPVEAEDFVEAFPEIKLPKTIQDTALLRLGDTTTISKTVFTQFVPDSALHGVTGKLSNYQIKPVGKIPRDEELYLLAKFVQQKQAVLGVFVFDNNSKFLGAKELVGNRYSDGYSHMVNINREPTFIISREKISKDNQLKYTRTGYAYTKDVGFMVVMNDSNEDLKRGDSILNPIDTFPKTFKYAGDYVKNKKNFISLRNGPRPNTYLFFVHFEKNKGECTGELKGEMVLRDDKTGQYTAAGDPCVINFKFSGSQIQMKEEGSCGNHRGIKCFFDDRFTKKKEAKAKQKKKK